jgi:uncharacterized protein
VPGSDANLEEMLARLANIELFAVFMRPTEAFQGPLASAEGRRMLTEHLEYLFEVQRSGKLFAAGPLDLDLEHISGMCILHAPSREDAKRIAFEEPYHKAGWRTNTVQSWQLNEGLLIEAANTLVDAVYKLDALANAQRHNPIP